MRRGTASSAETNMDVMGMLAGAGISVGVGILSKAVGFWKDSGISEKDLQDRISSLKEEMKRSADDLREKTGVFNDDLRRTISELSAVTLTLAKLQASQDVTNANCARMLDLLSHKMETHDKIIAETQVLMGQLLNEIKQQHRN